MTRHNWCFAPGFLFVVIGDVAVTVVFTYFAEIKTNKQYFVFIEIDVRQRHLNNERMNDANAG